MGKADRFSQLSATPNIFAAGDLHTGRATVISAVAGGRLAARSIHYLLTTGKIPLSNDIQRKVNPKIILKDVQVSESISRVAIPELPVEIRCRSFVEEVKSLSSSESWYASLFGFEHFRMHVLIFSIKFFQNSGPKVIRNAK